jgi:NAD(P)-dependent dehydrogenase (short-subunit alcohol dehydrogenase family)
MMSQVWLITGSSRGLGRAFAEAALASGFQVATTARNTEDLAELKDKYGDLVLHC